MKRIAPRALIPMLAMSVTACFGAEKDEVIATDEIRIGQCVSFDRAGYLACRTNGGSRETCFNEACERAPACGDGNCNGTEDCTSCASDCGACTARCEPGSVSIDEIANSNDMMPQFVSMALDGANEARLAFEMHDWVVGQPDPGIWRLAYADLSSSSTPETVFTFPMNGGNGGPHPKVAVDRAGGAHIAFQTVWLNAERTHVAGGDVRYAKRIADGSWSIEVLDADVWSEAWDIKVDAANVVHVVFGPHNDDGYMMQYARIAPDGSRTIEPIAPGWYGRLALDASGRAHLLYRTASGNQTDLRYASRNSDGTWTTELVGPNGVKGGFIGVDGTGRVHVAYDKTDNINLREARYATRSPTGVWSTEILAPGTVAPDFAAGAGLTMDPAGNVRVIYSFNRFIEGDPSTDADDHYDHEVRYLTRSGTGPWTTEVLDLEWASNSIAVGSDNALHLAYDILGVKHARLCP